MLKIASYNLNGIRSALNKGLLDWLSQEQPDIFGIQEAKAQEDQVDLAPFRALGYEHVYWHSAEKKGYSGVVVFSKIPAQAVHIGIGDPTFDAEGRVLRLDFQDFTLVNSYWPSGTSGDVRQDAKYRFLDLIYTYTENLLASRPKVLIQGDFNIAHTELDIHNPKTNQKTSGFLPEERAWLTRWLKEQNFHDAFRSLAGETQKYSWWSMRSASARAQNKGWRIDYQCLSDALFPALVQADLDNHASYSDHCPSWLTLNVQA